jgi:hypothetical protein
MAQRERRVALFVRVEMHLGYSLECIAPAKMMASSSIHMVSLQGTDSLSIATVHVQLRIIIILALEHYHHARVG